MTRRKHASSEQGVEVQAGVLAMDRRGFLAGVGVALSGLPVQALAAAPAEAAAHQMPKGTPRRAIHQDLAYIDSDGIGAAYDAPHGNQATRDYVNSLTQEQFLSRHWFT
jgi:hypothetical protein